MYYRSNTDKQRFQKEYLLLKKAAREYYKYVKYSKLNSLEVEDQGRRACLRHASQMLGLLIYENKK